jgi:hypothetical protein
MRGARQATKNWVLGEEQFYSMFETANADRNYPPNTLSRERGIAVLSLVSRYSDKARHFCIILEVLIFAED